MDEAAALTRPFRSIILDRLRREPEFGEALLHEAAALEATEPAIAAALRRSAMDAKTIILTASAKR